MHRRTFVLGSSALLISVGAGFSTKSPAASAWQTAASLPMQLQEIYPAVHQGRLFVAGGIASKFGVPYFTKACFSYNPETDQWREEADLPEDLHHASLVSTGDRLFVVGGFHGSYLNIWRMRKNVYELVDGQWHSRAALPKPQAEGVLATAPDGAIHLATGQSPLGADNSKRIHHQEVTDHYRWLPDDQQWQSAAPIPTPRNSATGTWVGNQLIVTGGRTTRGGNLSVTEIYDLKEDRWRNAQPLPLPQAGLASVAVEDGIIVIGGEIFEPESKVFKQVWRYSISRDQWQPLEDMVTPRHGLGAGRFGNRIYVIGGATEPSGSGTSALNEVLVI